jgi:hypothetical protein
MSYQLSIEEHSGYVHTRGSGDMTPENALRFLVESSGAAKARGKRMLLLEFGFTGPSLNGGAIYDIITARSSHASAFERIAYVDVSSERNAEHKRFAETLARNRGVNVRLFPSVEEGRQWLASPADAAERVRRAG